MNVFSLDNIQIHPTDRISTGFAMLDVLLGRTGDINDPDSSYGAVRGTQILLAGASGCGKSRLSIDIASNMNYDGLKVLYFQLEANLSDFKAWTKGKIANTSNFFVSEEKDYKKQADIIKELKPDIVIVDSVNKYEVHHSKVGEVVDTLQGAAREVYCVNFLIGQLDMKGGKKMEVRGSQDWVFLVDVVLHAYKHEISFKEHKEAMTDAMKREAINLYQEGLTDKPTTNAAQRTAMDLTIKDTYEEAKNSTRGQFIVAIPEKNRFGSVGSDVLFQHDDQGVFEV